VYLLDCHNFYVTPSLVVTLLYGVTQKKWQHEYDCRINDWGFTYL